MVAQPEEQQSPKLPVAGSIPARLASQAGGADMTAKKILKIESHRKVRRYFYLNLVRTPKGNISNKLYDLWWKYY